MTHYILNHILKETHIDKITPLFMNNDIVLILFSIILLIIGEILIIKYIKYLIDHEYGNFILFILFNMMLLMLIFILLLVFILILENIKIVSTITGIFLSFLSIKYLIYYKFVKVGEK